MQRKKPSVRLAFCALLIGTASVWALAPHDKAIGVHATQLGNDQTSKSQPAQSQGNPTQSKCAAAPTIDDTKATRERQEDRNDKLRGDTIAGIIGTITVCVLLFQTRVFGNQAKSLRRTIDVMEATRADQTAAGQEASQLAARHAAAAEAAALAAQRSLTGAEAPYLYPILEHVPPKDDDEWPMLGTVLLRFGNFGRGPALVRGSDITIATAFDMPPVKSVKGQHFRFEHVLPAGVDQQLGTIAVGAGVETAAVDGVIPSGPLPLYVTGYIRYADLLGTEYVTELCQLYRPREGLLRAIGGAERNRRREVTADEIAAMRAIYPP